MSNSKKRRARQKAFRAKAYADDATPMFMRAGHNVPFAHRLSRKSPKEIRKNVDGMVNKWKDRYYTMKAWSQQVQQYLVKGPELERLRGVVEHKIFGQFGMDTFEVINNIHTPDGFQRMMRTPLWTGGKCLLDWNGDALPEFGRFETDESKEGMISGTCT